MLLGCDTSSGASLEMVLGKVCCRAAVLLAGLSYLLQEREMTWTHCRINQFIQLIDKY